MKDANKTPVTATDIDSIPQSQCICGDIILSAPAQFELLQHREHCPMWMDAVDTTARGEARRAQRDRAGSSDFDDEPTRTFRRRP
jgi:hypothetical protein